MCENLFPKSLWCFFGYAVNKFYLSKKYMNKIRSYEYRCTFRWYNAQNYYPWAGSSFNLHWSMSCKSCLSTLMFFVMHIISYTLPLQPFIQQPRDFLYRCISWFLVRLHFSFMKIFVVPSNSLRYLSFSYRFFDWKLIKLVL